MPITILPPLVISSLQWVDVFNDPKSLLAVQTVDFSNYSSLTMTPSGNFNVQGSVPADGVVVDNQMNNTGVTVSVGIFTNYIPPFQKELLTLSKNYPNITFTGSNGIIVVQFYTGTFKGSSAGLNAYLSAQAANVATLTNGSIDAYLDTVSWNKDVQLGTGVDLNTQTLSGFFDVNAPLNGPLNINGTEFYLSVVTYSQSQLWCKQQLATVDGSPSVSFTRYRINGLWQGWTLDGSGANGSFAQRNLLHNGSFQVNQRGYVSGTGIASIQYTHDRWFNGGGASAGYTFTAPPLPGENTSGHPNYASLLFNDANLILTQHVPAIDVEGGAYTLSWGGHVSGQVQYYNGTSTVTLLPVGASGRSFTAPAGVTLVIAFANLTGSPASFFQPQLEIGQVPHTFFYEEYDQTFKKCERFYQIINRLFMVGYYLGGYGYAYNRLFRTQMYANPTITITGTSYYNSGSGSIQAQSQDFVEMIVTVTATGVFNADFSLAMECNP